MTLTINWQSVLSWVEGVVGFSLLYFKLFLYETEAGRLQNYLVDLWIRVFDHSKSVRVLSERLLLETNALTRKFFDALFGSKSISMRAIIVGASYSLAFYLIFTDSEIIESWFEAFLFETKFPIDITIGVVLLVLATLPSIVRIKWFLYGAAVLSCFLLVLLPGTMVGSMWVIWHEFAAGGKSHPVVTSATVQVAAIFLGNFLAGAVLVPILDCLWLSANRWALKWVGRGNVMLRSIIVPLAGILGIALVPFIMTMVSDLFPSDDILWYGFVLELIYPTRIFFLCVLLLHSIIVFGIIIHLLIWPALARIVYAAEHYKVFKDRRLFGTMGTMLFVHATSDAKINRLIEALLKD